ncbi:MAG: hypothetical protein N3B01_00150, partial [Verrucomicrobiae bacterium]|nr:hypothetical protein [Verrucomicrobiae bacterium]
MNPLQPPVHSGSTLIATIALITTTLSGTLTSNAHTTSTEHFWYRAGPKEIYVDSQRDHLAFGYAPGKIFLSKDNGRTWPQSIPFPDAERITFSHIFKNGNVIFATETKIFLSADGLNS